MSTDWRYFNLYSDFSHISVFTAEIDREFTNNSLVNYFFCPGKERGDHIKFFVFSNEDFFLSFVNTIKNIVNARSIKNKTSDNHDPYFENFPENTIQFAHFDSNIEIRRTLKSLKLTEAIVLMELIKYSSNKLKKNTNGNKFLICITFILVLKFINPNIGSTLKNELSLEPAVKFFEYYHSEVTRYFRPFNNQIFKYKVAEERIKNNFALIQRDSFNTLESNSSLHSFIYLFERTTNLSSSIILTFFEYVNIKPLGFA